MARTSGDSTPAAERGDREQAGGDKSDLGLYPLVIEYGGVTVRALSAVQATFRESSDGVSVAVNPRIDRIDAAARSARREGAAGEIHEWIQPDGMRQLIAEVTTPDGRTSTTVAWGTSEGGRIERKWGLPTDQPDPAGGARRDRPGMPPPPDLDDRPPFGFAQPPPPETPSP